ncbi:suppressor of fused domain protein [Aeromicrobium sp.]|uniref:suppressor of fused domain protein n=1 Tax=Aeromicrobium sp. TaxID=1871063 RepID=UPI0035146011
MFGRRRARRREHPTTIRHQERERPFEPAGLGCSETVDAVDRHLEQWVGPVETVFHEIVSDLVHVDVHLVPAGEGRPFHTLATSGMSDRRMTVPENLRGQVPDRLEVMVMLPPDWPVDEVAWVDERSYWPVRALKVLARFPHEYGTWLGAWHSLPNGDPAEPYADDTRFCGLMLAPPIRLPQEARTFRTDDGRDVAILAMLPLLPDELEVKLTEGVDGLLDGLDAHGVTELLDPDRPSVLGPVR